MIVRWVRAVAGTPRLLHDRLLHDKLRKRLVDCRQLLTDVLNSVKQYQCREHYFVVTIGQSVFSLSSMNGVWPLYVKEKETCDRHGFPSNFSFARLQADFRTGTLSVLRNVTHSYSLFLAY